MDIAESDPGALGPRHCRSRRVQQPFHHILRHAGTIVRHLNHHITAVPEGADVNLSVPVGIGHAVVDGVFQHRLDDQLDGIELLHAVFGLNIGGELVLVAHLLNGEVMPGMLQLVGNGDHAGPPAQGDPEEAGQGGEHHHRILGPAVFRHPHHGVQGIVQEVGIDLGLQHIQFTAALLLFLLNNVIHQMAHGGDHGLNGVAQVFHLIGAAHIKVRHLLSGLQSLDRPVQLFHRGGDPAGQPEVDKDQQIHGKEHHKQEEQDDLSVVVPQRRGGHHRHQLPAGVSHGLDRHLPRLSLKFLRMGAVGISGSGQVVFLQEPGVNELLTGVVNDLSAAVRQIEISLRMAQIHILADLLNAAEAHVHQQHAALDIARPGQFHLAAQGDHPPVPIVRIFEKVLHMGGGKVEIFNPLLRRGEPGLPLRGHAVFQFLQRRGSNQIAVSGEHRNGHHTLPYP